MNLENLTALQFALLAIAFASGVMIGLQATVTKSVWTPYILAFLASSIGYAATVLL